MKTSLVLTYVTVLSCVIDTVYANLHDFVVSLTQEIGDIAQAAWTKITTAINRPVRIRRLGQSRRRKRTTTFMTPGPEVSTIAIYLFAKSSTPPVLYARPTIPVISTPPFKSLVEWRKFQIPYWLRSVSMVEETTTDRTTKFAKDPALDAVLDSIKARMADKYGIVY